MNELTHQDFSADRKASAMDRCTQKVNDWLVILMAIVVPVSTTGTSVVSLLLFLLFFISKDWRGKYQYLRTFPVVNVAVLLFFLFVLSALYSSGPWLDIGRFFSKYHKLLLIPVLVYALREPHIRQKAMAAFVIMMSLILALMYIKFYWYLPFFSAPRGVIFYSHIFNSMAYSFLFFYAALCFMRNQPYRFFYLLLAVATLWYLLFINDGRTGLVTLAGLIVFLAYMLYQKNKRVFIIGLLVVAVASAILFVVPNNLKDQAAILHKNLVLYKQNQKKTDSGLRLEFGQVSWRILADKPGITHWLIGLGAGSFNEAYAHTYKKYKQQLHLTELTTNPMNQYLDVLIVLGLVGLAMLMFLYYSMWFYSGNELLFSRILGRGLVIVLSLDSLFNTPLMDHRVGMFYVFFIALLAGQKGKSSVKHGPQ
jgi:O-antigen ligase